MHSSPATTVTLQVKQGRVGHEVRKAVSNGKLIEGIADLLATARYFVFRILCKYFVDICSLPHFRN